MNKSKKKYVKQKRKFPEREFLKDWCQIWKFEFKMGSK